MHERLATAGLDAFVHASEAQRLAQAGWALVRIVLGEGLDMDGQATRRRRLQEVSAVEAELIANAPAGYLAVIDPSVDLPFRCAQKLCSAPRRQQHRAQYRASRQSIECCPFTFDGRADPTKSRWSS